jgi:hypothetical protein
LGFNKNINQNLLNSSNLEPNTATPNLFRGTKTEQKIDEDVSEEEDEDEKEEDESLDISQAIEDTENRFNFYEGQIKQIMRNIDNF